MEQFLHFSRAQYETAYLHTHKLTIRAPLEGEIKKIFVAPKQTILEGDPLFSLQVDTTKEIILTLSFEEYLTLLNQETVTIIVKNTTKQERKIPGTTLSRSPIANENGMYTLHIVPTEELDTTFTEVQVFPEIQSDFFFLPKDFIEIINPQTGYLYIIEENQPKKLIVPLGQHRNEWIEVEEPLNPSTQIIKPF
ncbi:MAG: HlyD family secretion protein [Candidatus Peribacteria bacterium]|nr:HlyD family secretion protein [Candidatus Peribacteria bacterium]